MLRNQLQISNNRFQNIYLNERIFGKNNFWSHIFRKTNGSYKLHYHTNCIKRKRRNVTLKVITIHLLYSRIRLIIVQHRFFYSCYIGANGIISRKVGKFQFLRIWAIGHFVNGNFPGEQDRFGIRVKKFSWNKSISLRKKIIKFKNILKTKNKQQKPIKYAKNSVEKSKRIFFHSKADFRKCVS